jgi:non-specific protein-tyrosine kinase
VDLRDYVRLLRRRWRLILLVTTVGAVAGVALSVLQPKVYTAKTQLFVSAQDRASSSDITSAYTGGLFTQQRVKSYVNIITSVRTATTVTERLGLRQTPRQLAKHISASAPLDTVLISVSVTDPDPLQAQRIANAVGAAFPGIVDEIEKPIGGGPSPVKVSVVQPAQLPITPTSPRPKLNVGLGLLIGVVAAVGIAVLRETLDTTVKAPGVAEELVGAPMLGAISYDPEAGKRPLVVHVSPSSTRAEAFRQMRTNLQFVDIEHPLRSVVVTSSIPGEGKSTTTCNLAITLAQAGVRVALIEGDLRRPRIADYMGIEGAVGLTSVLLGRTLLSDALQPWGDGTLRVLASGPLPPNPSELLGSAGMSNLLRELEASFDLILIDAPPLLPVTDAAVLGAICSGVLMLIRSNATRREQVERATATVNAVGATVLGTILNMVPTRGPDAYAYGYGYGYGSRYYSRQSPTGRLARDEAHIGAVGTWAGRRGGASGGDGSVSPPTRGTGAPGRQVTEPPHPAAPAYNAEPASYAPVPPTYPADTGGRSEASPTVLPADEPDQSPGLWKRLAGEKPQR